MPEGYDTEELIKDIISEGKKLVSEVEVYFFEGSGVSVELKRNIIGEAASSRSWGMGIRTIQDGKIGTSSTNDPERWKDCLHAAMASGTLATPQEWHGLPEPADVSRKIDVFDPKITVDISVARDLVEQMLKGAKEYPADVAGGSAGISTGSVTLANSKDLSYTLEKTGAGISLETISGTSTGYEFDRSCYINDLDPEDVGRKAAFYAHHSVKGEEIKSGNYDIILSPIALSQLLGNVVLPAFSGRNVQAGRSYFADKMGEKCMDGKLSIFDDPFNGPGSTTWDAEGVPTKRLDFIRNGVLEAFSYDLKTAYRYGTESTGSASRSGSGGAPAIGVHNIYIDGARTTVDDEPAVYAHDLIGAHTANAITGDFSVELSNASWMEGGDYGTPIRSAMLSGNIFEMLKDVGGLGRESRSVGRVILPPVRFNNQQIIGK